MRDFPLDFGDAWFPAVDDPRKIYLSIDIRPITNEQIAWLREHGAEWRYEEW